MLEAIGHLQSQDHAFKTLVIDTINGVERLCHENVCHEHFGDDWGDSGFAGYARGPRLAVPDITMLLGRLDALRTAKGMSIILLAHATTATFKNPEGPDCDRYTPALHKDTLERTAPLGRPDLLPAPQAADRDHHQPQGREGQGHRPDAPRSLHRTDSGLRRQEPPRPSAGDSLRQLPGGSMGQLHQSHEGKPGMTAIRYRNQQRKTPPIAFTPGFPSWPW